MKKYILTIVVALGLTASISAQDSYYYCSGDKVLLTEHSTKVVAMAPKGNSFSLPLSNGLILTDTISDSNSLITVYELSSTVTPSRVKALVPTSTSVNLQSCYNTEDGTELIPDGYINVKLKTASDYSKLQAVASQYNCEIVEQNEFMPLWYSLRVPNTSSINPVEVANAIYETGNFESSYPSFSMDALEISYDPDVYKQWGLYNSKYDGYDINISKAWNYATGRGIKIAIVDEGIELTHQDLAANIYPLSYDAVTNSSPSIVYGDHATHCAGIAAAVRNNGLQIAGVAPDAKLMSVSINFDSSNFMKETSNALMWAWKNGADVISCSWTCPRNDLIMEAIDSAVTKGREGKGCVLVKSAGNSSGSITFPGNYKPSVLAVANMTVDGSLFYSSCYGSNMFITAPGTNILSTIPNNATAYKSGTSMAAPHVAGVAALILERNPKLSATKVREIMGKTAQKIGSYPYDTTKTYGTWNERYGYGLVDAYNAVINTPRN